MSCYTCHPCEDIRYEITSFELILTLDKRRNRGTENIEWRYNWTPDHPPQRPDRRRLFEFYLSLSLGRNPEEGAVSWHVKPGSERSRRSESVIRTPKYKREFGEFIFAKITSYQIDVSCSL